MLLTLVHFAYLRQQPAISLTISGQVVEAINDQPARICDVVNPSWRGSPMMRISNLGSTSSREVRRSAEKPLRQTRERRMLL